MSTGDISKNAGSALGLTNMDVPSMTDEKSC
jgi:hypothetical protein